MKMFDTLPKHSEPASDAYFIRPAVRREIPEISDLVGEAIGAYRGEAPDAALEHYIEQARDTGARWDRGEVLVATQYGRILGTVTFYDDASRAGFPASWASFGTLAVHPQLQRRGIASLLVRRCVAAAIPLAPAIGIHTGSFMLGARRLYEGMGFVRSPRQDMRASDFVDIERGAGDVDIMAYRLDLDTALSG
jgi:predicted N-acetyltransferase YhbS